eukprot:CAMPEP_0170270554 /NCGR_PEP_ID=MMETSP0116_2-20130129/35222_1 /TAXON_ID=400756 /ORGANISM="Durinskia baltica, Strain CSIRO CS-38" /LENGTH=634 /DNA_ID=CAMNT_0010521747 /DNA_START=81 /DNA_END=1985 /DNA_ORIENTATION=+
MRLLSLFFLLQTTTSCNGFVMPSSSRFPSTATRLQMSETAVSIDSVKDELRQVEVELTAKLEACESVNEAEALRREYFGKKGPIQGAMKYMRDLAPEDKPKLGVVVNQVKDSLEIIMKEAKDRLELQDLESQMESEKIDVTMPGLYPSADIGRRHPLSMTMEKAVDIFVSLGYDTVTACEDSPEVESDYYCFEALNCPKDHPARDMQDTFYLTNDRELMLRTHTSAVQIRQLEKRKPPLRIVAPGRVYRRDDIDATHSLMFHQVEILALEPVGELDLGHLKGTVEYFLKKMLGPDIETRFRGSYFPFTEPSMEVDVKFRGKWLEVLGCGMVDPRVLEMAGIDPEKYSGFAAGFGVERFAMIIHGIKDLREFTKSDARFLKQFPHFYDDGMATFLAGEPPQQPQEELRTDKVPPTIVRSWEELRKFKDESTTNGAAAAPVMEATKDEVKQVVSEEEKKSPPAAAPATKDEIDISKLDIRVGVITKAWEHPEAEKLFCEEIDLGEETGPRQIASGLKEYYKVDDLIGRKVLVLANLKARKLVGFPSHGMVLCASSADNGGVQFVDPPEGAQVGERVMVVGYDGEPATENQVIKKKMLEAIFPDLKTNGDGVATYKGVPLTTSSGPCRSGLTNAPIA